MYKHCKPILDHLFWYLGTYFNIWLTDKVNCWNDSGKNKTQPCHTLKYSALLIKIKKIELSGVLSYTRVAETTGTGHSFNIH